MFNANRPVYQNIFGGGGGGGDSGAKDAAKAQVQGIQKQIDFSKEVYNRQLQAGAPQRNIGNQALNYLGGLYGFNASYDPYPIQPFSATSQPGTTAGGGKGKNKGNKGGGKGKLKGLQNAPIISSSGRPYVGGGNFGTGRNLPPSTLPNPSAGFGSLLKTDPVNQFLTGDTQKALENDPGYQFRLAEGQKALDRQGAAAGRLYSGGQLKAAQRYGQDYASGEYQNAYNRVNSSYTDSYNRLASVAGLAQTGSASTNNALSSLGQQVGQGFTAQGDARASGYANQANARQSGFQNLLGLGQTALNAYSVFSGR